MTRSLYKRIPRYSLLLLYLLFTAFFSTSIGFAQTSFPDHSNIYVNDYANLLDDKAKQRIQNHLEELFQQKLIQMTVVTISSVNDYASDSSLESFATQLFNYWGIGDRNRNDGVLILVARNDRKMRIELGFGYEKAWDAKMKRVIDNVFIPRFKKNNYQEGIEKGVEEVIFSIAGYFPGEPDAGTIFKLKKQSSRFIEGIPNWLYFLVIFPLMWIIKQVRKYIRHRPRDCHVCHNKMNLLDEVIDDEYLDGGQRIEEYLDSIDYDVWKCYSCNNIDIIAFKTWFSKIRACKACNYKTLTVSTTILESATYNRSGRKRLDYYCKNCGFEDFEIRTIPRKTKSSSSSSFGGGGSSGGGASGSW